jgi:hypothetical protein
MTTYKITIKDNSIPEYMQKAIPNFHNEYTATFTLTRVNNDLTHYDNLFDEATAYLQDMATELDTDPESLEILSIIKQ